MYFGMNYKVFSSHLLLFLILLFTRCTNTSNLIPQSILVKKGSYHCWPYDVTIFSFFEIDIDSTFYTYPRLNNFDERYELSRWAKYNEFDKSSWFGMDKTLRDCDGNRTLHSLIESGEDLYYAGLYDYSEGWGGKKTKNYEMISFISLEEKELHVFKNMNWNVIFPAFR